jgi:endo-1,4-beta-D-glucanase Y
LNNDFAQRLMTPSRRPSLRASLLALGLLSAASSATAGASPACGWPAWDSFKAHMLSADGRVIDASTPRQHTVSEAQAYALLFALVADDRTSFERILQWTENNLAQGDFTAQLPAWQWGRRDDGSWGVIDPNPASDADVWIAYTLGEAGRYWHERRFAVLSALIGNRVLKHETALIPGLGLTLLPAPEGFMPAKDRWRLNPSYVPLQVLRRLHANDPDAGWGALLPSAQMLITGSAPQGFAPDWVQFEAGKGFVPDTDTQADGSYNAIRVYLWAGLMDRADPARAALIAALRPMARYVLAHGEVPEHVDTRSGATQGAGPPGFDAAMLPFLNAAGETAAAARLAQRLAAQPVAADTYYGQALSLFAQGGDNGPYRFAADGSLIISRKPACAQFAAH